MYNFQQSYELEDDQIPFLYEPTNFPLNLFSPDKNIPPVAGGRKRQKRESENQESKIAIKNNEKSIKKITHSEIERLRRQEMTNLYASLRSLLPLEYIKGKRSTSDHMQAAVNYINNMQKNISQLRLKKEMLMTKNPNLSSSTTGNASAQSCTNRPPHRSTVKLEINRNVVEILISLNKKDEDFPVSRLLNKLLFQGLDVISYLYTTSNDGNTLYKILTEVDDPSSIDIIGLQNSLTETIIPDPTSP